MSVKQQKPTIAVLTHSVITPRAHTTAGVNLGTWETDGTVQVIDYYMKEFLVEEGREEVGGGGGEGGGESSI